MHTRVKQKNHGGGGDQKKQDSSKTKEKGGKKGKDKMESSQGSQTPASGGESQSSKKGKKKQGCYLCKVKTHWTREADCPKAKEPTNTSPKATELPSTSTSGSTATKGLVGLTLGSEVGSGLVRTPIAVVVCDGGTLLVGPTKLGKYRQQPLINGKEAIAFRDTGPVSPW